MIGIRTYFVKLSFGILYTLLSPLGALAQSNVSGTIRDAQTGERLQAVAIYISELKSGVVSDSNGFYQYKGLNSGSYLFEISSIGYKKRVEQIQIRQDTILDFELVQSVSELHEAVVTGVTRATELRKSPIVIKPVDVDQISQNNSTNLVDALSSVPGISQITTGSGISKPTIRGLGYNRVISLYNGIRQEGQQWGDEHGLEMDQYSIDRIEIVKGPGSLLYGSDGIAGVLNFIANKPIAEGKKQTGITQNYQSNNNLLGTSIHSGFTKNGVQVLGRYSQKFASNYQNSYDAKVFNSGFRERSFSLHLGLNKKWGYTHWNVSTYNTVLNMVEGERDSLGNFTVESSDGLGSTKISAANDEDLSGYKIGIPNQDVAHYRVLSNSYFQLNKGTLNLDLGFQNNKRKEFGNVLDPDEEELFFDLYTFNYNVRYNVNEWKGWESSVGVSGMRQNNVNKGEEFLIPEYTLFDLGGFVFTQKTFKDRLTLAGGLRYDTRTVNIDELVLDSIEQPVTTSDDYTSVKFQRDELSYESFSGSIGVSYQMSKISTVKLNLGRGFRTPNIAEISSNGRHEGSLKYEYGNSELKPEISHQIDLAYFLSSDHTTFEFTPFANFISNYIYSSKLQAMNGGDSIPDSEEPVPAFQFTQGNVTLVGGEIYLDVHPHPYDWLHIEHSFSYVQATQKDQPDSLKYLPLIPPAKYSGILRAQFKKINKKISNLYIKVGVDHFFDQNRYFSAYGTETATPSYTLINAGFGAGFKTFGKPNALTLIVSIDNIADISYQSHLSRLKYASLNEAIGRQGVFNMGRNIGFKLRFVI